MIALVLLVLGADPVVRQSSLRAELLAMKEEDQSIRRQAKDGSNADFESTTRRHTERIREIIDQHGWPGRALVGEEGSIAAWLLAQHLDHDPALQKRCLALLERAVAANDADSVSLAFLTDRVLVNAGRQQRYGTQGAGAVTPADRARVNANGRALGLPPLKAR